MSAWLHGVVHHTKKQKHHEESRARRASRKWKNDNTWEKLAPVANVSDGGICMQMAARAGTAMHCVASEEILSASSMVVVWRLLPSCSRVSEVVLMLVRTLSVSLMPVCVCVRVWMCV